MYTVKAQNWIDSGNDDGRVKRETKIEETFTTLDDAITLYIKLQNKCQPNEPDEDSEYRDLENLYHTVSIYQNLEDLHHMVFITYKGFEFCSTYYGLGFSPDDEEITLRQAYIENEVTLTLNRFCALTEQNPNCERFRGAARKLLEAFAHSLL